MKAKINRLLNTTIMAALSLLGFSSCDEGGVELEYGTPTSDYQVKGKVTAEDGTPVKSVKVTTHYWADKEHNYDINTTYTDASGEYTTEEADDPDITRRIKNGQLIVTYEDESGVYANDTTWSEDMAVKKVKKGEGWSSGSFVVTANKVLKKK